MVAKSTDTVRTTLERRTEYHSDRGEAGRWDLLRVGLGLTYLLGGLAHFVLIVRAPSLYESFADMALLGQYTDLWRAIVVPNTWVLVPLVGVFEIAVGAALLWRGRAVRAGHTLGAAFQLGLVLSGPWGIVNALLALLHAGAARRRYSATIAERVRAWRVA